MTEDVKFELFNGHKVICVPCGECTQCLKAEVDILKEQLKQIDSLIEKRKMLTHDSFYSIDLRQLIALREGSVDKDNFVSGGRNPNWELVCNTCASFHRDYQHWSHGWCRSRDNHSVSKDGGCDLHSKREAEV